MKIKEFTIIFLVALATYAFAASYTQNTPQQYYPSVPMSGDYRMYLNGGESLSVVVTNSEGNFVVQQLDAPQGMAIYLAATYRVTVDFEENMSNPFITPLLNEIINQEENNP